MMSTEERFWAKVDKSGGERACWLWTGARRQGGYGQFRNGRRLTGAHRYAWTLANGPVPDGLSVCHTCDNPPCVNSAHLFLGTQAANIADMVAKGRHVASTGDANGSRLHPERVPRGEAHSARLRPERLARGEANGQAKLTAADIPVIRARCAADERLRVIAADYGVSRSTISDIARRNVWGHIP